jgi:hypothetical protein
VDPPTRSEADRSAIERVLATYCHRVDDADFEGAGELFTADGTFSFGADVATGPSGVADWLSTMQPPARRGKHLTANVVIDVDGDAATAASDFLFVRWVDGSLAIEIAGRYRDDLRRDGEGWRFERRRCDLLRPPH